LIGNRAKRKKCQRNDKFDTGNFEFSLNHGGTPEEDKAIVNALNGLDILRKDVAAWQGSNRVG